MQIKLLVTFFIILHREYPPMSKCTAMDTTVSYHSRKDEASIRLTNMARYPDAEHVDHI